MSGASGKVSGDAGFDRQRQPMSIEQLLVWAYADQMVHRATRGRSGLAKATPASLGASTSSIWTEGVPIEGSRNQGFEAADDAWAIHDRVMKLGRVEVDCGHDLAAARYHSRNEYRGLEPPLGGAVRDKTARGATSLRPWPTDGLLVIDVRTLVVFHASKATRPEQPAPIEVRFKPEDVVWHRKRRDRVYSKGLFCHVKAVGNLPGEAREVGEIYGQWWGALERLSREIQALRLTLFQCTNAMPPPLRKIQAGT